MEQRLPQWKWNGATTSAIVVDLVEEIFDARRAVREPWDTFTRWAFTFERTLLSGCFLAPVFSPKYSKIHPKSDLGPIFVDFGDLLFLNDPRMV